MEDVGDFARDDALGEALDDGGLPDAGLAQKDGVVLGAAAEDLDEALDLVDAADDGIEGVFLGQFGEVAPEGIEGGRLGLAAGLAGLAGLMAGPIVSVQSGMGEPILILTLVVIVTGGVGSIRGAFYGALIVGIVDTIGRAFLPMVLREFLERSLAQAAGPAIASMLIYVLMAVVLAFRPQGLFPVRHG